MVIAGKESVEHLIEAAAILKSVESSPSVIFNLIFRTKSLSKLSKNGASKTDLNLTTSGSDFYIALFGQKYFFPEYKLSSHLIYII